MRSNSGLSCVTSFTFLPFVSWVVRISSYVLSYCCFYGVLECFVLVALVCNVCTVLSTLYTLSLGVVSKVL